MTLTTTRPARDQGTDLGRTAPIGSGREPVVVAVVAVAALLVRAPFAVTGLWAEDGHVFLHDAIDHGIVPSILRSYEGYFHLVPRVIGAAAAVLPLPDAAVTTWVLTALVTGWCVASVDAASAGWLTTGVLRVVAALAVVALPALRVESLANAANLQFPLLFAALIVLLDRQPTRRRTANGALIVTAAALSSALSVILVPVLALRWLRWSRRRLDPLTVIAAVAIGVQLIGMAEAGGNRNLARGVGLPSAVRRFGGALVDNFTMNSAGHGARLAGMVLAGAVVVGVIWAVAHRLERPIAPSVALVVLGVPALGFVLFVVAALDNGAQPRYAVFPALCITWSVMVATDLVITRGMGIGPSSPWRPRIIGAVLATLALGWVGGWAPDAYRRTGPTWTSALAAASTACASNGWSSVDVPIRPVVARPDNWYVRLPCGRVRS